MIAVSVDVLPSVEVHCNIDTNTDSVSYSKLLKFPLKHIFCKSFCNSSGRY